MRGFEKDFLIVVFVVLQCTAKAATYYVATNGVDANAGATTNAPWRTIQHAADSLVPGDTVFVRGGIYNERVTFNVSGNLNHSLTFQNYPGETPIVDGAGLPIPQLAYATGLLEFTSGSYITVQGFEIRNYQTNSAASVPAGIDITGAPHDLTFISNRIHNIANLNTSTSANAYGIAVHGTSAQSISNLVFRGNEIYSNILGQSETFSLDGNCSGFEISSNRVHDNNNIGIGFIGWENVCSDPNQDFARNGVCRGNLVWNNSDISNPTYTSHYSSDGIYSDGGSNVVIELNQIHNCDIGVEMTSEHKGHAAYACVCRDNLIWSNNTTGVSIGGYSASVGRTINCTVIHNTLYHNDTQQSGTGEMELQWAPVSNSITHNIFVANSQNLFIGNQYTQSTNNVFDWNLYYSPGGTDGSSWEWKKTSYSSFSTWKSATTNDAHSVFAGPLFINPANGNFHLSTNSPAVNAGDTNFTAVTGETDIDLQPRIAGGRTDLGADELNVLTATLGISPSGNGQVQLSLAGEPGHPFVWEQSATLAVWVPFLTNYSNAVGGLQITNSIALGEQFFRARMTQ